MESPIPCRGPLNICNIQRITGRFYPSRLSRSSFNIINTDLITNVFRSFWHHELVRLELVNWVEGVRRSSGRFEMIYTRLRLFNVFISQICFFFIQFKVQCSRSSAHHIKSVVQIWPIRRFFCPNSWLCPYEKY